MANTQALWEVLPSAEQLPAPRPLPRVRIGRLIAAILIVSMVLAFLVTWASSSSRSPTAVPAPTASSPSLPKTTPPPPEQSVPWGTPGGTPAPPPPDESTPRSGSQTDDQSPSEASLPKTIDGIATGAISTSEVIINKHAVPLRYLEGTRDDRTGAELVSFLSGKLLYCKRYGRQYDCVIKSSGNNLGVAIIENGAAWPSQDAPPAYRQAQEEAALRRVSR